MRGVERVAVRLGVGEQLLLGLERRVLVGVVDRGGVDLLDLVPQQVDLAGARRGRRRRARRARRRSRAASRAPRQRGACRRRGLARVAVEQRALLGRVEQRLVRVLAVQVDEVAAALGELGRGREPAVDVAARAPVGGNDPREHDLVVAVDEPPSTRASSAPSRTSDGVGAAADSSSSASTISVLPAPVSPVIAVMPGPSSRQRSAMMPRFSTRSSTSIALTGPPGRTWPSGSGGSRGGRS